LRNCSITVSSYYGWYPTCVYAFFAKKFLAMRCCKVDVVAIAFVFVCCVCDYTWSLCCATGVSREQLFCCFFVDLVFGQVCFREIVHCMLYKMLVFLVENGRAKFKNK